MFPDLVIPPYRRFPPLDRSDGTSPRNAMNHSAVADRRKSPISTISDGAVNVSIPLNAFSRRTGSAYRSSFAIYSIRTVNRAHCSSSSVIWM